MKNKKIAILGIGNRLRGDDAAGSIIAENLASRGMISFDSSTVPENFTGALRKAAPNTLIIVDACSMGIKPGEFRKIPIHKFESNDSFNSHSPEIVELINYLHEFIPEILFIGIEPYSMELNDRLSQEVKSGIKILEEIIFSKNLDSIKTAE